MTHSFTVEVAVEVGVEAATILNNIYFWNLKNWANDKLQDDLPYTYNSAKAFCELFPYFNEKKIYRLLKELEDNGYIVTGNFNSSAYNRTKWYCVTEKFLNLIGVENFKKSTDEKSEKDLKKKETPFSKNGKSKFENSENNTTDIITDINTDGKHTQCAIENEIDNKIKNNEYAFQVFEKLKKNKILCSKDFTQFIMREWRIALPIIHNHGLHSDDVLKAIENYGEILALGNKTWWKVKQPFYTWCEKNILRFLPSAFNIDDYIDRNTTTEGTIDRFGGKKIKLKRVGE